MDFKDAIKNLGERVVQLKPNIQTEEATKNAFIMPFMAALGYDVFNPLEIVPEYVTDIGTKKGEKIDYAVMKDSTPVILVECKHWAQNLNLHDGQLLRYFHVSKARFGILTNGIQYRFYTDLDEANKMDEKPFFEFDVTDMRDAQVEELKKFHKSYFEVESILNSASQLKYVTAIRSLIGKELRDPSEQFVKYFVAQAYNGRATEKVVAQFTEHVKRAAQLFLNDLIQERLKSALKTEQQEGETISNEVHAEAESANERKPETTEEEMEGFMLVRAILRKVVPTERVAYRDGMSFFSILLDDSIRKPICKLYLNGSKKYLATFDQDKNETKHEITTLDDIYKYAEVIEQTPAFYMN
jgi:hypothetical protein